MQKKVEQLEAVVQVQGNGIVKLEQLLELHKLSQPQTFEPIALPSSGIR